MVQNLKFICIVTTLFLLQIGCFAVTGNIHLLKGSYDCLADDYKHLSPMHGAVALETGLTRAIYDTDDSATTQLAHILFHLTSGNFDISQEKTVIGDLLTPTRIGIVIAAIEKLRTGKIKKENFDNKFLEILNSYQKTAEKKERENLEKKIKISKKELNKLQKLAMQKHMQLVMELGPQKRQRTDEENYLLAAKKELQSDLDKHEQQIDQYKISAKTIRANFEKIRKLTCDSLEEYGYFSEPIEHPEQNAYEPFTTYTLFLAALYRKTSEKPDLVKYFQSLARVLGNDIFTKKKEISLPLQENSMWVDSTFPPIINKDEVHTKIKTLAQQPGNEDVLKHFEDMIFYGLKYQYHMGTLPPLANHMKGIRYKGGEFTDCCENAIRNICNIYYYPTDKGCILTEATIKNMPPLLQNFYNKDYAKIENIETPEAHIAWTELVSNISGCSYGQAFGLNGLNKWSSTRKNPYLRLNSPNSSGEGEKIIAGRTYNFTDVSSHKLCEFFLDLRSFIVIMNYLFALRLFEETNLYNAYHQENFITHYLPLVMKKLGWRIEKVFEISNKDNTERKELTIDKLDAYNDLLSHNICIGLEIHTAAKQSFVLVMTGGHAEIQEASQGSGAIEGIQTFFARVFEAKINQSDPNSSAYLSLLALFKEAMQSLSLTQLKQGFSTMDYGLAYCLALLKPNYFPALYLKYAQTELQQERAMNFLEATIKRFCKAKGSYYGAVDKFLSILYESQLPAETKNIFLSCTQDFVRDANISIVRPFLLKPILPKEFDSWLLAEWAEFNADKKLTIFQRYLEQSEAKKEEFDGFTVTEFNQANSEIQFDFIKSCLQLTAPVYGKKIFEFIKAYFENSDIAIELKEEHLARMLQREFDEKDYTSYTTKDGMPAWIRLGFRESVFEFIIKLYHEKPKNPEHFDAIMGRIKICDKGTTKNKFVEYLEKKQGLEQEVPSHLWP